VVVVAAAALFRSRSYAMFRGVALGLQALVASALWPHVGLLAPAFVFGHVAVFLHSASLIRPRMRSLAYRALVSLPSALFAGGTALAFPWAIGFALGYDPAGWWIPYVVVAAGMVQSLSSKRQTVKLFVADGVQVEGLRRHRIEVHSRPRPLRLVQITDPHLGPFMSIERLRTICQRAAAQRPDLVLLTGDFLTMESQSDPSVLARALAPLAELEGKVFACFGNHDLEAPDTVKAALAEVGATLLVDDACEVDTEAGRVQILGVDFRWRGRADHLKRVCADHPRAAGALRLVLLHDPGAFVHLPEGEADLVLSGHTHGGQLGLVSLGLPYTMLSLFTSSPDHGFWARATDRLYVHRGTGHYGFPVRIGVPAEESLLEVHWP
jgi:predicted MPP superfamily phosphohydrolase